MMNLIGALPRIVGSIVAAVFVCSVFGKLRAKAVTKDSLEEFGVPKKFVDLGYWALVLWEAVLSLGLLVPRTRRISGVCAFTSLAVFTGAVVNLLIRGKTPQCSCFGNIGNSRIGNHTIVRNVALAGLSTVTFAGRTNRKVISREWFGRYGLAIVVAIQGVLLVRLLRQFGLLIKSSGLGQPTGPKKGDTAIVEPNSAMDTLLVSAWEKTRAAPVLFLSEGCQFCEMILTKMAEQPEDDIHIIVVYSGSQASFSLVQSSDIAGVHWSFDDGSLFSSSNGIQAFPTLIYLDHEYILTQDAVMGAPAIEASLKLK